MLSAVEMEMNNYAMRFPKDARDHGYGGIAGIDSATVRARTIRLDAVS